MDTNKHKMDTSEFILQHRLDDPRGLALLSGRYPEVNMPYALDQIAGWQTARDKLPSWAAVDGIVYPPHISMEQCSSEAAASYKACVVARLLSSLGCGEGCDRASVPQETSLADLTGGFAVDFSFLAPLFDRAVYVERDGALCELADHNMRCLGLDNVTVVHDEAESVLRDMKAKTIVFLDPARRDSSGARTYAIGDCTPDVTLLLDTLMEKSCCVVLKLSPMLDWHKALCDLCHTVTQLHIVSVDGECKELLLVLAGTPSHDGCVEVSCVDIRRSTGSRSVYAFRHCPDGARMDAVLPAPPRLSLDDMLDGGEPDTPLYLHEPNASVMKAGCFDELSRSFGLSAVSPNSHLFLSRVCAEGFPGRVLSVRTVTTMNRRQLKAALAGVERANITVRNFPLRAEELRKRLRLKDGGDTYIVATTTAAGSHVLLVCGREL